jgi:Phage gp6-like head-tail connector protein
MAVDASLDALRQMIGARSTSDDALLTWALEAATDVIRADVYESHWNHSNVQYAVMLQAHRYYKRRTSATGVEGFGPEGFAVRVSTIDPDIRALLGPSRDYSKAGVA